MIIMDDGKFSCYYVHAKTGQTEYAGELKEKSIYYVERREQAKAGHVLKIFLFFFCSCSLHFANFIVFIYLFGLALELFFWVGKYCWIYFHFVKI